MTLQRFFFPFPWQILGAVLALLAISKAQAQQGPSYFKKDKDGVLWYQKGDDAEIPWFASIILSDEKETIVIAVTSSKEHTSNAVKLAKQMRTVLQKSKMTSNEVLIVAWESEKPDVQYRFFADGLICGNEQHGRGYVFSPAEAKKKETLQYIARFYQAARKSPERKAKSKPSKNWKTLKIVEEN